MWAPLTIIMLFSAAISGTVIRFTNLKCHVLDPTLVSYAQCDLKMIGRGVVALNIQAKILKGPVTNAKINLSIWRKYSGFRPFMYNTTFDFCKFISQTDRKLSFEKIVLEGIIENSDLNHSCPYDTEVNVKNMVLKHKYFKYFPVPSGDYLFQIMIATDRKWITEVLVYFLRDEGLMAS